MNTHEIHLLTVDDEEAIRCGIAAYFEDSGYRVSEASDGVAGLELIRLKQPDLIITDLRMPRMDGLELIDAVVAEFSNLPIIVLSGTGVLTDAIDTLRRGAWDYLTKPIQNLEELEIIVKRCLERARLIKENQSYQNNLELLVEERTTQVRKLTAAVEQSANAVVITDTEGIIEYVNSHFCAATGYEADEVIGQKTSIIRSGRTPAAVYINLWNSIKSGSHWRGELQNKRKDGSLYWDLCSIAPLRNEAGDITNFVSIQEDISTRKAQEEALTWQACHDSMTGLHNRYYLETHLASQLQDMDQTSQHLSLLLIDIDNLKFINDTFGHEFGDRLLIEASHRLKQAALPGCTVARFLGDEFAVVPPLGTQRLVAEQMAEQIKHLMTNLFIVESSEVVITASIGVATSPDDGKNVDTLLRSAEAAMYEAKRIGRNTIVSYTREFHKRAQRRLLLETRLHRALENNEFSLHYQPQIDATTGKIMGIEALLRWNPSDIPPVSPTEFIPILEETSLIVPVGTWVLYDACRQAVAWKKAGLPDLRISINISAVQFQRGDLDEIVRQVLSETGLSPSLLCLELTEGMLMADTRYTLRNLEELRRLGISLSLDDFGTGYSSLAYLSRLPVQELKVDQSFIKRLNQTDTNTAVVNTIIAMAQELGLEVVAEGVETETQQQHLVSRGCTIIQGFLYSEPLPAEQFVRFVHTNLAGQLLSKPLSNPLE